MHRNARLTVWARKEIVPRRQAGWTLAEIARQLNVPRPKPTLDKPDSCYASRSGVRGGFSDRTDPERLHVL